MQGAITSREFLANWWLVWREFGTACFVRCLWACAAGQRTTFLEVAVKPELR
jgi:hypothetical protein